VTILADDVHTGEASLAYKQGVGGSQGGGRVYQEGSQGGKRASFSHPEESQGGKRGSFSSPTVKRVREGGLF